MNNNNNKKNSLVFRGFVIIINALYLLIVYNDPMVFVEILTCLLVNNSGENVYMHKSKDRKTSLTVIKTFNFCLVKVTIKYVRYYCFKK